MTHYDRDPYGPTKRGRGTGKPSVSIPRPLYSRDKELIEGGYEIAVSSVPRPLPGDTADAQGHDLACEAGERDALAHYLASNPGMTSRDWKGKGFDAFNPFDKDHVRDGEMPWHELDPTEVRKTAIGTKARYLTKGQRQAAARDPGLVWDPISLAYCLRPDGPRCPSTVAGRQPMAEGVSKVPDPTLSRPAAATNLNSMTFFHRIFEHD